MIRSQRFSVLHWGIFLNILIVSALFAGVNDGRGRIPAIDECDSLFAVVIQVEDGTIRLSWYDLPGVSEWVIFRGTKPDMSDVEVAAIVQGTATWVESVAELAQRERAFYWVAARWNQGTPDNYTVIEDFEGAVVLGSYTTYDDQDPDAWERVQDGAYNPFEFSLELNGNTWKRQTIDTVRIEPNTVWRVAVKAEEVGESHAIGMADSANEMWYCFWGREIRQLGSWNNIYQGWAGTGEWMFYDLPVGEDWMGRFGYCPAVDQLLYANDGDQRIGIFRIDEIRDVTGTLNIPPHARFRWQITGYPHPDTMEVSFCSMGCDPEGPIYDEFWVFGDGTTSTEFNPVHRYAAGGVYSVALTVGDTSGNLDWVVHEVRDTVADASGEMTILFTGDIMLARRYVSEGLIPTYGVDTIFSKVRPLVSSVDFAMCNLECPLTDATDHHPTKLYYFKGEPEYVEGLTYAGFDYCATANNHTFDYLAEGMMETMAVLDSVGLLNNGSGMNDYLARQPVFYSVNGICVAVLSFCNRDGTWDNEQPYLAAGPDRPGFAFWDRTAIEQTIPAAREIADMVIVQVHSGFEYATEPPYLLDAPQEDRATRDEVIFSIIPDTSDVDLRHYAIDMGADLVVNHHPHVIQGCEFYNGKLIAHSMGNFAFDQTFAETFFSMVITGKLMGGLEATDFVIHPIFIDRYIPGPATGGLGGAILDYLSELSRPMNTWIMRNPFADTAIILPAGISSSLQGDDYQDTLALENRDGYAVSAPYCLDGGGYPVEMAVVVPMGVEYRLGREVLWYGNIEDEGATPWDLNSNYERYDATFAHSGLRSIRLNRGGGFDNSVSTNLRNRWPIIAGDYSMSGYIYSEGGREIKIEHRYWNARTGGAITSTQIIGEEFEGSFPWRFVWRDLDPPPAGSYYYDVRVNLRCPASGEGFAWFDDLALIRWDDWQTGAGEIPFPSNITYVQVRAAEGTETAVISYRREWYFPLELSAASPH